MPDQRPQPDEYSPHHEQYVSLITRPILEELNSGRERIAKLAGAVAEDRGGYRYADRKWTIREVIGHMADAERIHTFRALTFARNDRIELPKWGPDAYAAAANFNDRTIRNLAGEQLSVRDASIALFSSLPSEAWAREGTVSGKRLTVRAIAYIAAGHVQRHLNILRERYGVEV